MIEQIYEIIEYDDAYLIICNYEALIEIDVKLNHEDIYHQKSDFPNLDKWKVLLRKEDIDKWARKQLGIFTIPHHYIKYNYNGGIL
jgi:hypothetical protein